MPPMHDATTNGDAHAVEQVAYSGDWYSLVEFGTLQLDISYYIDALTVVMFCMVTLIASCIHFYAIGYMHDELHDVTDHEVTLPDGHHLHRPGRFHRFFQYLSLFCFSMLGLVHRRQHRDGVRVLGAGRHLLVLPDRLLHRAQERLDRRQQGVHRQPRRRLRHDHRPDGPLGQPGHVRLRRHRRTTDGEAAAGHLQPGAPGEQSPRADRARRHGARRAPRRRSARSSAIMPTRPTAADSGRSKLAVAELARAMAYGYWLLVVAGLGIFCGCVGKSAQFPLHVWLPDAMEGPTPVSALVHSATMVAAGVYLVGRFYPGLRAGSAAGHRLHRRITLFLAATIAITAIDIKRVLAYSHGQPARLHDAGPGRRRLAGRPVPPDHARLLQEPAVHVLRLGDPRRATPTT